MDTDQRIIERGAWVARLCRDDDKTSILQLSAFHYGEKEQAQEGYFDWLYSGTPDGRPIVAVAEDLASGEIVGFIWHLPFRVIAHGVRGVCLLGCNALVHPDYRLQGVYLTLRETAFQFIDGQLFTFGFPKPTAIYPHGKVGVLPVTRLPLLVLPLDMEALSRARFSDVFLRAGLGLAWRLASSTLLRPRRSSLGRYGIRICEHDRFDERFDRFWEKVAGKYAISVQRDSAFLNWRFCAPSFRSYHTLSAQVGGALVGYIVLRSALLGGVRAGLIMDFLVESGDRGGSAGLALLEEARRWFSKNGLSLAGSLMLSHTHEYSILKQAGFVECPERFAPQAFTLAAKGFSPNLPEGFLMESRNWFISSANHDAV